MTSFHFFQVKTLLTQSAMMIIFLTNLNCLFLAKCRCVKITKSRHWVVVLVTARPAASSNWAQGQEVYRLYSTGCNCTLARGHWHPVHCTLYSHRSPHQPRTTPSRAAFYRHSEILNKELILITRTKLCHGSDWAGLSLAVIAKQPCCG